MEVVFLGTGTSHGIPAIACDCAVCRSDDPRNRRMRPSVLLSFDGRNVVIDTSTDFRWQMLANDVRRLDAILITHAHADHIFGLDDVRRYNDLQGEALPCYAAPPAAAVLRRTFAYIFDAPGMSSHTGAGAAVSRAAPLLEAVPPSTPCASTPPHPPGMGWPVVNLREVTGPFDLFGRQVVPVPVKHGTRDIVGYRIGGFAYVTDASAIPDSSRPLLAGLDVLVINALRRRPHPTHFSLAESLAEIAALGPRRAFLTHMCHDIDHQTVSAELPQGVALAVDGLRVTL